MKLRLWVILAAALAPLVAWRAIALAGALADASHSLARAEEARAASARIESLRAQQPTAGLGARPKDDLLTLAHAAAATAALPISSIRDVSPSSERRSGPAGFVQQSATMTLEPLALPELGQFLAAWVRDQRIWTVERINLTALRAASTTTPARFRVQLSLEARYLAGPGESRTP